MDIDRQQQYQQQQQQGQQQQPQVQIKRHKHKQQQLNQQAIKLGKNGEPLSEYKKRRLEGNRVAAQESRRRKWEGTKNMQRQINILEGDNLKLRLQFGLLPPKKKPGRSKGNRKMDFEW